MNLEIVQWQYLQKWAMKNPENVLKTTFEIKGLEALYTLAEYKWKCIRKNAYRYDWIYVGELFLEYVYSYEWVDKIFQHHPTCPICLELIWEPTHTTCNKTYNM
ncbi:hypothetical protein CEXT_94061 [Caerostris extrusa]|uniref:Uncharacterized protein n=1 Tax=Caerostris extrusa TaxID=172846 RepID=A0AAV4Q716_CAEEX|nr:hypothetical protein CEXT_94061 [Caerostris extrusa]